MLTSVEQAEYNRRQALHDAGMQDPDSDHQLAYCWCCCPVCEDKPQGRWRVIDDEGNLWCSVPDVTVARFIWKDGSGRRLQRLWGTEPLQSWRDVDLDEEAVQQIEEWRANDRRTRGEKLVWDVVTKASWLIQYEEAQPEGEGVDPDDPEYVDLCEQRSAAIKKAIEAIDGPKLSDPPDTVET